MTCVCGHPDSAHDSRGCRVTGCSCDSFAPMPQIEHGGVIWATEAAATLAHG
jgi:hypothetical protein